MAESCSDLDTQHSVGQELHGLLGLGHLTAVMCLEYNEINFCEDVSVTANQCVIWVYWLHFHQHNDHCSMVSSPELTDLVKEDFTQDVITLILKEKLLIVRCGLGVDKQSWALVRLITLFIWQIHPDMSGNMQMCKMTINGDVRRYRLCWSLQNLVSSHHFWPQLIGTSFVFTATWRNYRHMTRSNWFYLQCSTV